MTTKISSDNIQTATLSSLAGGPRIANIQVANVNYSVLDDTAVSLDGGYLVINGAGFQNGATVVINGNVASSVSFVSSTTLRANVGGNPAGTYIVYVTNPDGSAAVRVNGITYSALPGWVTGSSLPAGGVDTAFSLQLSATSATTYSLQPGSSLPSGLTLAANGLISGTVTGLTVDTTYNFTIIATDAELQDSPRAFSVTITVGDLYWKNVTAMVSPVMGTAPFNDDISTNNANVLIFGDTKPTNFSPYRPGYYSNFFNGTTDFITAGSSTNLALGSGDFTVEMWVNPSSVAVAQNIILDWRTSNNGQPVLYMVNAQVLWRVNSATAITSSINLVANVWQHVALVKRSGTTTLYIDGRSAGSFSDSNTYANDGLRIGKDWPGSTNYWNGNLADVRIVKGTAVYTGNFTPPTSPLTAITNTQLLTCRSRTFEDISTNGFALTLSGTPQIRSFTPYLPSPSFATYGSTYFDGAGDYLTSPSSFWDISTYTDWTIEFWVYPTVSASQFIFQNYTTSGTTIYGQSLLLNASTNNLIFEVWQGSSAGSQFNLTSSTNTVPLNTWTHIAITRSGSSTNNNKLYINGVLNAQGTWTTHNAPGSTLTYIGCRNYSTGVRDFFTGYIADMRVVRGTSVYTSNTTPTTSPLTAVANTSLLTLQTNQPVTNSVFLDSSTNYTANIVRNGNATQGSRSPYGINWSAYFDGTGDYLTTSAADSLLTSDFTAEFFVYYNTFSSPDAGYQNLLGVNNTIATTGNFLLLGNYNGSTYAAGSLTVFHQNTAKITLPGGTLSLGTWYHIALVRQGGTSLKLYINGSLAGSATINLSDQYGAAGTGYLIATQNGFLSRTLNGYISNMRITSNNAVYTSNTFTVPNAPLQPIASTILLTCQDNRLIDNSPLKANVVKSGDVATSTFGPFPGRGAPASENYSVYFNGNNAYVSNTGSASIGTGPFTIEAWINPIKNNAARNIVGNSRWQGGDNGGYIWALNSSNQMTLSISTGTFNTFPLVMTSTGTVRSNVWSHVAVTRDTNNFLNMYINGVSVGTPVSYSASLNLNNTGTMHNLKIGTHVADGNPYDVFYGHIADLRISNVCIYTSNNFAVPTAPLTVSNSTILLACQANTLIDVGPNNFIFSTVNAVYPTKTSPYTVTYPTSQTPYSANVLGGSMYFDGTGDYLSIAHSSAFNIDGIDATAECWFYPVAQDATVRSLIDHGDSSASWTGWQIYWVSQTVGLGTNSAGTQGLRLSSATLPLNTWHHVAMVKVGTTFTLYINGVQVATGTSALATNITVPLKIGTDRGLSGTFNGYISDVRITTGTALYLSNFVPPDRTLLPAVKNTTLLVSGASAGVYDSSRNSDLETFGDAKLFTSNVVYSTTSLFFDGSDYLAGRNDTPEFGFGTGDFTVEMWVFPTATNSLLFFDTRRQTETKLNLGMNTSGAGVTVAAGTTTVLSVTSGAGLNKWTHVAVTRASGSLRMFFNGTQVGSTTSFTTDLGSTGSFCLGAAGDARGNSTYDFKGYLADVRVTKGYARYTSNFTAPTAPLTIK